MSKDFLFKLSKYDSNGPRYTSYPSAASFTANFTEKQFLAHLTDRENSPESLSIYIHIPFCHDICYFCACNKIVTRDQQIADTYLSYLKKEINLLKPFVAHREISSLHLGGGSPNFLNPAQLTELIFYLSKAFNLNTDGLKEYSIEIDPRSTTIDFIPLLSGLGFNRLSMGVQDFDPKVQQAIHRKQSELHIKSLAEKARENRFLSVNYDLMYGLPYQTHQTLSNTLDLIIDHAPDRIAVYNYAHMPDKFKSQRAIDRLQLPSAQAKLQLFSATIDKLTSNSYDYIGLDHFAKYDSDLALAAKNGSVYRNFQGYAIEHAPETIGIGVSAISSLKSCFSQNTKDLKSYYQQLDNNNLPVVKGLTLSMDDRIRSQVIQSLTCQLALVKEDIETDFNIHFDTYFADIQDSLNDLIADGLVTVDHNIIRVTKIGRYFLRNICMIFDSTLNNQNKLFSKTI